MTAPDRTRRRLLAAGLAAGVSTLLPSCRRANGEAPCVQDVAQIECTPVSGIAHPRSTSQVQAALSRHGGAVSIGGARYSMGGQIVSPGSLHLDMRGMDGLVRFAPEQRCVRVQPGMRWRDLQSLIDPHDLSVRVMQSYSNFSVGGSVSVNCHGRYVGAGTIADTVRALQLVTGDGAVHELSRDREPALFGAVLGGYGAFGVVTEVELELDRNTVIERQVEEVALADYPAWFHERVLGTPDAVLHNADLSPPSFDRPLAITWRRSDRPLTEPGRLAVRGADYSREQNLIWAVSELPAGDRLRERFAGRAMHEPRVIWRNREASLDAASLEPRTRSMSTYLLQEYFIPVPAFAEFSRAMARVLHRHGVNALNVSIRHAAEDRTSLLAWAREDVFSFVLYYKQRNFGVADREAGVWTRELIDAALDCGGRFYLPYRLHATAAQFRRAYPAADSFASIKHRVDPRGRFRNRLLERYLIPA